MYHLNLILSTFYEIKHCYCHSYITKEESKAQRSYSPRATQILSSGVEIQTQTPHTRAHSPSHYSLLAPSLIFWRQEVDNITQSTDLTIGKPSEKFKWILRWHECLSWSSKQNHSKFMWSRHLLQMHYVYCFLVKAVSMIAREDIHKLLYTLYKTCRHQNKIRNRLCKLTVPSLSTFQPQAL